MKSFVSTVVGGAIGLIALYVVGRVAYQAGHDMAQAEQHYEEVRKKTAALESSKKEDVGHIESAVEEEPKEMTIVEPAPMHKQNKLGLMIGLKRLMSKKESVLGRLVHHPEDHRIEAFVDGDELKVSIKPRTA